MRAADIRSGKYFVGGHQPWLREVLDITGEDFVLYQSFDLRDGSPISHGGCSIGYMARWATRPAIPEEIARLQIRKADEMLELDAMHQLFDLLQRIPDKILLVELERRGYRLVKDE